MGNCQLIYVNRLTKCHKKIKNDITKTTGDGWLQWGQVMPYYNGDRWWLITIGTGDGWLQWGQVMADYNGDRWWLITLGTGDGWLQWGQVMADSMGTGDDWLQWGQVMADYNGVMCFQVYHFDLLTVVYWWNQLFHIFCRQGNVPLASEILHL